MDNPRICYYIQDNDTNFDGNDVPWVSNASTCYNLKDADVFTYADAKFLCDRIPSFRMWPAHKVSLLISFHVPVRKLARLKPKSGELCVLLCTRETVGKNASFWRWDHHGYSCDTRAAQIFKYDEDNPESSRSIDVSIPFKKLQKHIEHRIDMQDLCGTKEEGVRIHHSIREPFFT